MRESLAGSFTLRLMDLRPFDSRGHELVVGDVTDLAAARDATRGSDALVIAHMATRQSGSYDTPVAAFDVNVKGTANLLFAAAENGIRRVVLISSCGVVYGYRDRELYHREHGMKIAALRIGGLLHEDTMVDKHGRRDEGPAANAVDPRTGTERSPVAP